MDDTDPAVELEAEFGEVAQDSKALPFVQLDRGFGAGGDHRDHLAKAEGLRADDDLFQQGRADAVTHRVGRDVEGILAGKAISRPRPKGRGVGEADGAAAALGDNGRVAEFGRAGCSASRV